MTAHGDKTTNSGPYRDFCPHVPTSPPLLRVRAHVPAGTRGHNTQSQKTNLNTRGQLGTTGTRGTQHSAHSTTTSPQLAPHPSRLDHPMQQPHPRPGRRPGRRFLALSSDAIYTGEPLRRLEATGTHVVDGHVDPPNVVELVGMAVALRDEPECVSDSILDNYGADALFFQSARHAATVLEQRELRRALPVEDRVRDCWARMKRQHRQDLRGELLALDKAVERATRSQPARLELVGNPRGESAFSLAVVERPWLVVNDQALVRLERVEAELDRAPGLERAA